MALTENARRKGFRVAEKNYGSDSPANGNPYLSGMRKLKQMPKSQPIPNTGRRFKQFE